MGKLIDLAGLSEFKTKLATIFAAKSHNHAAGDINSGELSVSRGGTGKNTHTSNAVLTGNGTSAVKNVATASGAFYATAANGAPVFGALPIAQGGTGSTTVSNARTALGVPPTSHASTSITYGAGTASNYGHVKVSDSYTSADGAAADSVAASSQAVNDAYTANSQAITNVQDGLAIIVDGDTCSTAVPINGYAYIKNNTHGLTEGLYINTSSSAFPTSGGTADSTVFTAVSTGGLNSLNNNFNSKIANFISLGSFNASSSNSTTKIQECINKIIGGEYTMFISCVGNGGVHYINGFVYPNKDYGGGFISTSAGFYSWTLANGTITINY